MPGGRGPRLARAAGRTLYAFRRPPRSQRCQDDTLAACGLGYRLPLYPRGGQPGGHRPGLAGPASPRWTTAALREALLSLTGVGPKIAQCVMLFGFHRMDAFPLDVWMNRVMERHYPNGFRSRAYTPYNGVMQQYLFYAIRTE